MLYRNEEIRFSLSDEVNYAKREVDSLRTDMGVGEAKMAGTCKASMSLYTNTMERSLKGFEDASDSGIITTERDGRVFIVNLVEDIEEFAYTFRVVQLSDGEDLIPWTHDYDFVRDYIESLTDEEKTYISLQRRPK